MMNKKMRVCIVAEGCYPYVIGGVSGWINSMIRSFPNIEFIVKEVIKGVEFIQGKTFMGYDLKNGKLLEAIVLSNSPNIMLAPCWFTSPNTLEQISIDDISHPETARWKWSVEFKTADMFILTETINNKISFVRPFSKQKM